MIRRLTHIFTVLTLLLLNIIASATPISLINFERIELPANLRRITSLTQDSSGYIYITTHKNGIFRFSGNSYKPMFQEELSSTNEIYKMIQYVNGKGLFFESSYNLYQVKDNNVVEKLFSSNPGYQIADVSFFQNSYIINIERQNCYDHYWLEKDYASGIEDTLYSSYSSSTLIAPSLSFLNQKFIVAKDSTITLINRNTKTKEVLFSKSLGAYLSSRSVKKEKSFTAVYFENDTTAWATVIGDTVLTILKINPKTKKSHIYKKNLAEYIVKQPIINDTNIYIKNILSYGDRYLLFCGSRFKLGSFDKKTNKIITALDSPEFFRGLKLSGKSAITNCIIDRSGLIWLIDGYHTLYKEKKEIRTDHILAGRHIRSVLEDDNCYWFASDSSIIQVDKKSRDIRKIINTRQTIMSIILDQDKNVLAATRYGIYKYYRNTGKLEKFICTNYFIADSASKKIDHKNNHFQSIVEGQDRNFWCCTIGSGLKEFIPATGKFSNFPPPKKNLSLKEYKKNLSTYKLEIDFNNILWIFNTNGIVHLFDPTTKTYVDDFYDLHPDFEKAKPPRISSTFLDSTNLWIVTYDRIYQFNTDTKSWKTIDTQFSERFFYLTKDKNEKFWCQTERRLVQLAFSAEGLRFPVSIPSKHLNSIKNNYARSSGTMLTVNEDNNIIICGVNGADIIHSQLRDRIDLPISLESFYILGVEKNPDNYLNKHGEIEISSKNYAFSFSFFFPNFDHTAGNLFSYTLTSESQSFSSIKRDHKINYDFLLPGHYTLTVQAADPYGNWSNQKKILKIHIKPRIHQTVGFFIIVSISSVLLVLFAVWTRLKSLDRQKQQLQFLVDQRTRALKDKSDELEQVNQDLEERIKDRTIDLEKRNKDLNKEILLRESIQEELELSERRARALLNAPLDAAYLLDIDGNILDINEAAKNKIRNYLQNDDTIPVDFLHRISDKKRQHHFTQCIREKRDLTFNDDFDGYKYNIHLFPIISEKGDVSSIAVYIKDITAEIEAKKVLLRSRDELEEIITERTRELETAHEELKKSEEAKRENLKKLTLQLAHEIKNPLASIKSSSELMMASNSVKEPKLKRHIRVISRNIDICNRVIQELYLYTSDQDLNFFPITFRNFINQIHLYALNITENKPGIHVQKKAENISNITIYIDEFKLSQAVKNLVNNAIEALDDMGEMTISGNVLDEQFFQIIIRDTGKGMEPGTLEQIFKPFYTQKSSGFGLGLCLVEEIVNGHNGKIVVESKIKQGTTFTLTLPLLNST